MSSKFLDEDNFYRFDRLMEERWEERSEEEKEDDDENLKIGKSQISQLDFINKYVGDPKNVSSRSLHPPIPSDRSQLLHKLRKELSTRLYTNYEFLQATNLSVFKQSQGVELPIVSSRSPQKVKIENISNIPLKNRLQTRLTKSAAFNRKNNLSKQKSSEKKPSNKEHISKTSQLDQSSKTDSDESIDKDVRSVSEVRMICKSKNDERKNEIKCKNGFEMIKFDEDWFKSKTEKLQKFHEERLKEEKQIQRFQKSLIKDVVS